MSWWLPAWRTSASAPAPALRRWPSCLPAHPGIRVWTHLDERSCAYFALGMAKASRRPVAILCSSGTAAVNFAPAVVEAYHAGVPLLVLTADRPQELRDLGANQTIDQVRLYGQAAKWFVEMPLPESSEAMLRYVRMVATRAIADRARKRRRVPCTSTFPFREPLVPAAYEFRLPADAEDVASDSLDGRRRGRRADRSARRCLRIDLSEAQGSAGRALGSQTRPHRLRAQRRTRHAS